MRIDYIELKNFRQFADVKIHFANSQDKNFTIIKGPNGAGKTNILNAITWCLFGEELHVSKYKGLPMVNTTMLEKTSNGSTIKVRVDIQFEKPDGKKILVSRSIRYQKKDRKIVEVPLPHPPPNIMREGKRDWSKPVYGSDAQYQIENMIPQSIEEYFFFDGERMNDYFRKNTGKDIRKAVNEISQIELLNTLINHLLVRRNAFLSLTKGLSSDANDKKELIDIHERSLITDSEELNELEQNKMNAELLETEFAEKLKNSSLEYIQELGAKRKELEEEIDQFEYEMEAIEAQELKKLHKNMPIILTNEALLKTSNLIQNSQAAGKIPPKYERIFIQNLLKKNKCLCGIDISKKDKYSIERRKKVETYLDVGRLPEISTELIETNALIQDMLEDLTDFPDDIIGLGKRLKTIQRIINEKKASAKEIGNKIAKSDDDDVRKWELERKKNVDLKNSLIGKIALVKDRMERRRRIIKASKNVLKREFKKEKKYNRMLKIFEFCNKGIKCAEEIQATIMKEVKRDIEEKTSQQFLTLIWKKDTFEGVLIDQNYNISVPHVSGREALGTLSAGERQVCALSFMAALNSVSGFDVPIIIDTPLARISGKPRVSIAKNLPDYLEGKQVTLLVTEDEYTREVKDALSPRVDKTYQIVVQEMKRGNLAEVILSND